MRDHVVDHTRWFEYCVLHAMDAERVLAQVAVPVGSPAVVVSTLGTAAPAGVDVTMALTPMHRAATSTSHKDTAHRARRGRVMRHSAMESMENMDTKTIADRCGK